MYELALMLRGRARQRRVLLISSEPSPLAVFGREPSRAIGEMLARAGIELIVGADPHVAEDGTAVGLSPEGRWLPVDRIVAPALLEGPRLPGVPHDDAGFIRVDEYGRVPGLERVYAAGDGTDFPVKQGGLAAQQADAAVRHLVAEARRAAGAGAVPPRTAREAHHRRPGPLPTPRSGRGGRRCSTCPCGSRRRRSSATIWRRGSPTATPRGGRCETDVEPVGVDRELGLEPLGHIGPVTPAMRGLDLPRRLPGG